MGMRGRLVAASQAQLESFRTNPDEVANLIDFAADPERDETKAASDFEQLKKVFAHVPELVKKLEADYNRERSAILSRGRDSSEVPLTIALDKAWDFLWFF